MTQVMKNKFEVEMPVFNLYTLYGKKLGVISGALDITYITSLTGMGEISFTLEPELLVENRFVENPYFQIVTGDMLIQTINIKTKKKEVYWIDKVTVSRDTSGKLIKQVHAFSREYEFTRKRFGGIDLDGRILYYSDDMPSKYEKDGRGIPRGILNDILAKRGWKLKYIDETVKYRARTVSIGESTEYELFMQLQEIFDAVFFFDSVNKTLEIRDIENIGSHSGLVISEKNIIENFTEDINYKEIITRLYAYGEDELSIGLFNPTGKPYVENFSYYRNEKFMSPLLLKALDTQEERINSESRIKALNEERVQIVTKDLPEAEFRVAQIEDEIRSMQKKVDVLKAQEKFEDGANIFPDDSLNLEANLNAWIRIKDSKTLEDFISRVENSTSLTQVKFGSYEYLLSRPISSKVPQEIKDKFLEEQEFIRSKGGLKGWRDKVSSLKNRLNEIRDEITGVQGSIDLKECFPPGTSKAEIDEALENLSSLVSEGTLRDESYSLELMDELVKDAYRELHRRSMPRVQFDVGAIDFSKIVGMEQLWIGLNPGDRVQVRTETGFDYELMLIKVEHTPHQEASALNLTFSTHASLYDSAIFLADLIANANSSAGLVQLNRPQWNDMAQEIPKIKDELEGSWDIVKNELEGASPQYPILDERGLWLYALDEAGNPKPEQVRAINNIIALTKDNWDSMEVAISPLGINANVITTGILNAGLIRTGVLQNTDGSVYFDLDNQELNIDDYITWDRINGFQMHYIQPEVHELLGEVQEKLSTEIKLTQGELEKVFTREVTQLGVNIDELEGAFIKEQNYTVERFDSYSRMISKVEEDLEGQIVSSASKVDQRVNEIKASVDSQGKEVASISIGVNNLRQGYITLNSNTTVRGDFVVETQRGKYKNSIKDGEFSSMEDGRLTTKIDHEGVKLYNIDSPGIRQGGLIATKWSGWYKYNVKLYHELNSSLSLHYRSNEGDLRPYIIFDRYNHSKENDIHGTHYPARVYPATNFSNQVRFASKVLMHGETWWSQHISKTVSSDNGVLLGRETIDNGLYINNEGALFDRIRGSDYTIMSRKEIQVVEKSVSFSGGKATIYYDEDARGGIPLVFGNIPYIDNGYITHIRPYNNRAVVTARYEESNALLSGTFTVQIVVIEKPI